MWLVTASLNLSRVASCSSEQSPGHLSWIRFTLSISFYLSSSIQYNSNHHNFTTYGLCLPRASHQALDSISASWLAMQAICLRRVTFLAFDVARSLSPISRLNSAWRACCFSCRDTGFCLSLDGRGVCSRSCEKVFSEVRAPVRR